MAEFDAFSFITQNAPQILQAGGTYLANKQANKSNEAASREYINALQEAAGMLNTGYDDQLGIIESGADKLQRLLGDSYSSVTKQLTNTGRVYGEEAKDAYADYADFMYPTFDTYEGDIQSALGNYADNVLGTEQQVAGILEDGSEDFSAYYEPYMASGQQGLNYLTGILSQNPNEMTLSQQRMWKEQQRSAMQALAASGLRGAGRSGVAAVNEGNAALLASMEDQNRTRMDRAAELLNTTGYNASGQVAGNASALATNLADLRAKSGGAIADTAYKAGVGVGESRYKLGADVGDKIYATGQNVAQNNQGISKDVADITGKYYGNLGDLLVSKTSSQAGTALNKATVNANARSATGAASAQQTANTGYGNSKTLGAITGQLANTFKSALTPNNEPPVSYWQNPDTGDYVQVR